MADINSIVLPDGTEYPVSDYYLPIDISNPTDGQVLKYDATNQVWYNGDDAEGSSVFYGTSAPTSQLGVNGNLYVKYTEGTGGASDTVDDLYVKLDGSWCQISTGGGGTSDYNDLTNKPQINSVELSGNKSLDDLGIQSSEISKTATGSIVTFSDGGDNIPVESFECEINPVQDLHGYDHPWPAGGGKSLIPFSDYIVSTASGMTITEADNGGIKISGQPTLYYAILTPTFNYTIASGTTITLSVAQALTHRIYINLTFTDSTTDTLIIETGSLSATMTLTKEVSSVRLDLSSLDTSVTYNETIYVMLEKGSTASAYEPYENICPISGHTQADIMNKGKNLLENEATSGTVGTITFTVNADKSITVNGSTTTQRLFRVHTDFSYNDNLIITGVPSGSGLSLNVVGLGSDTGSGFAFNGATARNIQIVVPANSTIDNVTVYPMVRLASDTDNTYEPYTTTLYSIDFGQTVYGGRLIYSNGQWAIEATHKVFTYNGDENWVNVGGQYPFAFYLDTLLTSMKTDDIDGNKSNMFPWSLDSVPSNNAMRWQNPTNLGRIYVYDYDHSGDLASFKAMLNNTPLQATYKLATPVIIPLTSLAKIKTLSGVNNIFSNTGDSTLKYFTNNADKIAELVKAEIASTNIDYHKYSTEEKIVGEWIDGKPIYEKTYTFTAASSTALARKDLGIPASNISDAWIDTQNTFAKTSGLCTNASLYDGSPKSAQFGGYVNFLQTNLAFDYRVGSDLYGSNIVLTIRYTKSS